MSDVQEKRAYYVPETSRPDTETKPGKSGRFAHPETTMHGPTGTSGPNGNSGPGPTRITIAGIPLNPQHWWLR